MKISYWNVWIPVRPNHIQSDLPSIWTELWICTVRLVIHWKQDHPANHIERRSCGRAFIYKTLSHHFHVNRFTVSFTIQVWPYDTVPHVYTCTSVDSVVCYTKAMWSKRRSIVIMMMMTMSAAMKLTHKHTHTIQAPYLFITSTYYCRYLGQNGLAYFPIHVIVICIIYYQLV